jgi:hypothetical protein
VLKFKSSILAGLIFSGKLKLGENKKELVRATFDDVGGIPTLKS